VEECDWPFSLNEKVLPLCHLNVISKHQTNLFRNSERYQKDWSFILVNIGFESAALD